MREGSRGAPGASGSKEELVQEGFQEEAVQGLMPFQNPERDALSHSLWPSQQAAKGFPALPVQEVTAKFS